MKGVRLLGVSGEWKIYENESVASIIYGTSQVMSEKNYDKLDYPYNQTTLLQKAVVPESATKQTDSIAAVDNLGKTHAFPRQTVDIIFLPGRIQKSKQRL